jgi:hypothetical protein
VFAVVVRPAWTLPGFICALAPRATTVPPRRPLLAVVCARLGDFILMCGCAAVTTVTADCTACAAGRYQLQDSEQFGTCAPCFSGEYAAGAYAPQLSCFSLESRVAAAVVTVVHSSA